MKTSKSYTATNLEGAIINGLNFADGCNADQDQEVKYLKEHVRHLLAHKFADALEDVNDETALKMKQLWESITGDNLRLTLPERK